VIKQLGVDLNGSLSYGSAVLNFNNSNPFTALGQPLVEGNAITGQFKTVAATLRAMERAGVIRTLAEPTLTAISGESAKFTAGGEIPVPASQNCTGGVCSIGIAFKTYGVTLNFTPVVMAENRISVRVATEVSEIDQTNSFTFVQGDSTVAVPAFTLRKTETTVELASGGTMMTAGLIQQRSKAAVGGLPGLVNLPILGALFRSRDYQRQETELMIMVTPYIAKAMEAKQVVRPDDGFIDAQDGQGILLGRLNRVYGSGGAAPLGANYRGRVGFITD
jgi:pilus assembly protein CpaC